jgi:HSP20 family protein
MLYPTTRRPVNTAGDLFNSRLGRVFEEALQSWATPEGGSLTSAWWPACDVFEDKESIKIVVEIPGVKPEDVKLSLENNLLTIRGEKRQAAEEQTERVHRYERSYGSFERAFALPSTVDPDRILAAVDHGILTVTLPKADRAKPREIQVTAG